jgi:predicted nicotinamide N-methyase
MSNSLAVQNPPRSSLGDRAMEWVMQRSLRAVGPLRVERVELPGTTISLEMKRPSPPESGDQLPYWAEIWPSGIVLAGMIARDPERFQRQRVLELGPGVGVTAVIALRAGADLVVADAAPGCLALCALNAREQAGIAPKTLWLNWREPSPALFDAAGAGFSIVLAADVLYEREDVMPLVRLVSRILAPDGELWLAEPGRNEAGRFVESLGRRGWTDMSEECDSPWADPHDGMKDVVTVHRLRRSGKRSGAARRLARNDRRPR